LADIEDDNLNDEGNIDATDPIVRRAHRRFKKCQRYETDARNNFMLDLKFANGDVYNNYQWPIDIYQDRGARPSLTVNEVRQHNLHIINEAKQNKAEVKYRPTGAGATEAAAEVYEGLYRHISNISNAQMAQGQAISFQVQAGLGFTVIEADYVEASPKPDSDAFNQEIYIRGINDPMSVYLDCDCSEPDGTGARYGFIFTDRPKDEVVEKYPKLRGKVAVANAVDGEDAGWIRDDHVREARYYEVTEDKDELLGDDVGSVVFASKVPAQLRKRWEDEAEANGTKLKTRPIIRKSVKSHLIIGNDLIETTDLPGTAVPIVPWCGEITYIEKRLDRVSHTRAMISAQQMANYNYSASVEYGALQSKSPYIGPAAAIEGYETYWESANLVNHGLLVYNHRDDQGNEIPAPVRQEPPTAAPVYVQGIEQAEKFMMSVSGQYEAELGAPGNEKSGRAINERQRQGDRATYHFIDSQALAIRRQGVIIKEWIPVIYDTVRTAKILGVDGEEAEVRINPDAAEAHSIQQQGAAITRIFNPKIGSYEVVSDVGPNYATQRQEAFNAIVQILTQAPDLIAKIGDILFKVADFPMADELAERLKPGLPPEAQAQLDQLQKVLQASQERGLNTEKLLHQAMEALAEERLKAKAKDQEGVVDEFKADTERVKMLIDAATKADLAAAMAAIREMLPQAIRQAMQDNLGPVRTQAAGDLTDDFTGGSSPGLDSATPLPVPDVGQQAAQPGGQ
jgi:hypothetical protein